MSATGGLRACGAFVEDVDRELQKTTWVNKGTAHGYYRHASGKVILAIPRHNSREWHDLRQPRMEDFQVTKREGEEPAVERQMEMLNI